MIAPLRGGARKGVVRYVEDDLNGVSFNCVDLLGGRAKLWDVGKAWEGNHRVKVRADRGSESGSGKFSHCGVKVAEGLSQEVS